jgi:hypothetical protein
VLTLTVIAHDPDGTVLGVDRHDGVDAIRVARRAVILERFAGPAIVR